MEVIEKKPKDCFGTDKVINLRFALECAKCKDKDECQKTYRENQKR